MIRDLTAADTVAVVDLYRRSAAADAAIEQIDAKKWDRFVGQQTSLGGSRFLVAETEGCVVALVTSSLRRTESEVLRHFRIVVEPFYRRQGIGRGLLETLVDQDGQETHALLQSLCPEAWRSGQAFLERYGFGLIETELDMRCTEPFMPALPLAPNVEILEVEAPAAYAEDVSRLHNLAYVRDASFVPHSAEAMAERLRGGAELWLARHEGTVVGFCHVEPEAGATWIESIVVARELQGRRIGTRLAGAVLAEIVGRRKQVVRLQVSSSNVRARTMYERLGFVTVTQSMRYRAVREDVQSRLG